MITAVRSTLIDGMEIHLTEGGSGPPLLLIHGIGGPQMWKRVLNPLADDFQLLAIDLPGFGESDCPPRPYSTHDYCEFLLHALETVNCRFPLIAGISYGAQIAATFARLHPHRLSGLVLIDSTGLAPNAAFGRMSAVRQLTEFALRHIILPNEWMTSHFGRLSFHDITHRPPDFCRTFHRQISQPGKQDAWINALWNIFDDAPTFDRTLSEITAPTLILWGADDRLVSARCAEMFARLIRRSRVVTIARCSHSLPLEKPAELCDAVHAFAEDFLAPPTAYPRRGSADQVHDHLYHRKDIR